MNGKISSRFYFLASDVEMKKRKNVLSLFKFFGSFLSLTFGCGKSTARIRNEIEIYNWKPGLNVKNFVLLINSERGIKQLFAVQLFIRAVIQILHFSLCVLKSLLILLGNLWGKPLFSSDTQVENLHKASDSYDRIIKIFYLFMDFFLEISMLRTTLRSTKF